MFAFIRENYTMLQKATKREKLVLGQWMDCHAKMAIFFNMAKVQHLLKQTVNLLLNKYKCVFA